jgi:hypothetical protein
MQHAAASKPAACMLYLVHAMPATVSSPKNDPYYKKMIENQDPRSHSLSSCHNGVLYRSGPTALS